MTNWSDKGERLDPTIDDVARQMTEGAPGADFRARVLARIDEGAAAAAWWRGWLSARTLVPLAAAAVLLIVVIIRSGPRAIEVRLKPDATTDAGATTQLERDRPETGDVRLTKETTTATQHESAAQPPNRRQGPDGGRVRLTPDATHADVGRAADIADGSEVAALAPPRIEVAPLTATPLEPATIEPMESIEVAKLEPIAPVAVPPLDAQDPQRRFP